MTSPHILLEKADDAKNWEIFKQILNTDKDYLLLHLELTRNIFHWNVYDLSIEKQNEILN
jgi:hypothetical protein